MFDRPNVAHPQEERPVLMGEKLVNMKLALYAKQLGPQILELTPDQALELALQAEEFKKSMSPFDPAYQHFVQQELTWTDIASLLEKRALHIKNSQAMVGPVADA